MGNISSACWQRASCSVSTECWAAKYLGVAEAVAAPGGLHMGAAVHALRLSQHALHALQIALDLLLAPCHRLLVILQETCVCLIGGPVIDTMLLALQKGMRHTGRQALTCPPYWWLCRGQATFR